MQRIFQNVLSSIGTGASISSFLSFSISINMSPRASTETHSQGYTHRIEPVVLPASLSEIKSQRSEKIMVKFSKQFEGQLVPEWKEAFVDYWQLKKELKKLHLLNSDNTPTKQQNNSLPDTILFSLRNFPLFGHQHRNHGAIQVLYYFSLSSLFLLYIHYYINCTSMKLVFFY